MMTRVATALEFRDAIETDAEAIASLQNETADELTRRYGKGHWTHRVTLRGVAASFRHARIRVGRDGEGGRIVTVLRLAKKKPWAIDVRFFTPVKRPLYLTGMAVSVAHQGHGLGLQAMDDARAVARSWPADAIRLDAYDAAAGAAAFYEKCGYAERGRVVYRASPLVYFELVLDRGGAL